MTKNKIIIVVILVSVVFTLGIGFYLKSTKTNDDNSEGNNVSNEYEEPSIADKVEEQMQNMTIEEKIAQMLIVNPSNTYLDEDLLNTLHSTPLGGIILMGSNIVTYEQTKKLVDDIQANSSIRLIISTDEEGGSVQRLNNLQDIKPTYIPYMYDLGKTNDDKLAYQVGKVVAEELRTIGVNVVYAPVIDIYSNKDNKVIGKRSFGEDKDVVSKMAISLAKGLEDNGIIPTYKHFPGHGDTSVDSHYNFPIINKSYEDLKNLELTTFQSAIDSSAKIIMVGHIALPNITGDNTPASLSKVLITDVLKNDMKYDGLVITDALNMGALAKNYTDEQIYINAVNAGVDMLLMPNNYKEAIEVIKNNISEDRINESVKKILTFKFKYLNSSNNLDSSYLGSDDHKEVVSKIEVSE